LALVLGFSGNFAAAITPKLWLRAPVAIYATVIRPLSAGLAGFVPKDSLLMRKFRRNWF
jgi:hypothetical protein